MTERSAILILAALIVAGFALRWAGIGDHSLGHPEMYIPGVSLSPETTTPPPRYGFVENLVWHFHNEPHPIGYYMGMFGWTLVFDDSETSLRAPSVLFGTGSIILAYLLGASLYGRAAGLISAALLAFNGFHIFWGGIARMYAPGCFFVLLATLLLVRISSRERAGAAVCAAYVFSIAAALQTTELSWALFGVHVAWAALFVRREGPQVGSAGATNISALHALAFILSAPALLHAAYSARGGAAGEPDVNFLAHYLAFGFLFEPNEFSEPHRIVNNAVVFAAAMLAMGFALAGLLRRSIRVVPPSGAPFHVAYLVGAAIASVALMQWLAAAAERRGAALAIIGMLPLPALAWPWVAGRVRPLIRRISSALDRQIESLDSYSMLLAFSGIAAPLAIFVASFWKPVTEFRAFIVFTPFYLIIIGAGLSRLKRRRAIFALAISALFALGVYHAKLRPATPRDYRGIAEAIAARSSEPDLIFIRRKSWMDAPVTYYLPHEQIVGSDFAAEIASRKAQRVWTIRWGDHGEEQADAEIADALAEFVPCETVSALRAVATLHIRANDAEGGKNCALQE